MATPPVRFCSECGAPRDAASTAFCRSCGAPFAAAPTPIGPAVGDTGLATAPTFVATLVTVERQRPLWMVSALTIVTFGLYLFVWLGVSWSDMKRARRDARMHPVWHALTQFVPVYGLFRIHAHFRTLDEMLQQAGSDVRTSPGLVVVAMIATSVLSAVAAVAARPAGYAFQLLSLLVDAFIVYHGQSALNTYYRHATGTPVSARIRGLEWAVLVVGGVFFALYLIGVGAGAR